MARAGLHGKVTRTRETTAGTTVETVYYLLSKALSAKRFNQVVRSHWGIENRLHWRLDVVMNEDYDRNRTDNGPYSYCVIFSFTDCRCWHRQHGHLGSGATNRTAS